MHKFLRNIWERFSENYKMLFKALSLMFAKMGDVFPDQLTEPGPGGCLVSGTKTGHPFGMFWRIQEKRGYLWEISYIFLGEVMLICGGALDEVSSLDGYRKRTT